MFGGHLVGRLLWLVVFGLVGVARAEPALSGVGSQPPGAVGWIEDVEIRLPPLALSAWNRNRPAEPAADVGRRLQLLAQVGHALHADGNYALRDDWLAIMGWVEDEGIARVRPGAPRWRSHETSLQRFPVPDARFDPVVDFAASFALAYLNPTHFSCDFPLRARFMRDHGLLKGPLPAEAGTCHSVRTWLRGGKVAGVDLIYVAQRWQDAAASMGHVFLRVRLDSGTEIHGGRTDPVFAWVATDPPDTEHYILKGLTGGLHAGVKFDLFGDVQGRYGVMEGRDMFVYELKLSTEETAWLIAAVAARRGGESGIAYAFFTENCATMAWKLLRSVLSDLPAHPGWMFHPHEVASGLVKYGRAHFVEVLRARRGRGIAAEGRRDTHVGTMAAKGWVTPEAARLVGTLDGDAEARAETLAALAAALRRSPPATEGALEAWSAWVDMTLDIEAFAIDVREGEVKGHHTSAAFEAALALRGELGVLSPPRPLERPPGAVGPSGSRRARLGLGARSEKATLADARALVVWETSVLDEQPGEARQTLFRRTARIRLLANRLVFSSRGQDAAIEENRLTILETADWGDGFVTEGGWLAAHVGWTFATETMSRPRQKLPFSLVLKGGPGLRVLGDANLFDYLVIRAEFEAGTWVGRPYANSIGRGVGRIGFESAVALGTPEHRWRTWAFVGLGASLAGLTPEYQVRTRFEFNLSRASGLALGIEAAWRDGLVVGNGWEASIGLVY